MEGEDSLLLVETAERLITEELLLSDSFLTAFHSLLERVVPVLVCVFIVEEFEVLTFLSVVIRELSLRPMDVFTLLLLLLTVVNPLLLFVFNPSLRVD